MADEITDDEIARFAGAVKEAEERDAAGRARGAVVATARFGRRLLARLERAEKDAEESYLRGKTDGANEEHSLNWQRENSRIATLERERDEARAELTDRIASIMHNPDIDGGSLAAELIREGRERERKDSEARIATLEAAARALVEGEQPLSSGVWVSAQRFEELRSALRGVEGK